MSVWLLELADDDYYLLWRVQGVYSTEELAEAALSETPRDYDEARIREWRVQ